MGCCDRKDLPPLDEGKILRDKRVVAWCAWFVSDDYKLLRFWSDEYTIADLPTDGFLCARTRFADGTGENIQTNGWIVAMDTPAGLIIQSTGEYESPESGRYSGARFIRAKLCPSAALHLAFEEAARWQ